MKIIVNILVNICKGVGIATLLVLLFYLSTYIGEEILQIKTDFVFAVYYLGCGDVIYHIIINYWKMIKDE